MNSKKFLSILTDLGLSENEARVYLSSLSLGSATVLHIARAAGIKRTTVYPVMESIKQKGLVGVEIKGFKKRFVAEAPEKLEGILETRRDRFRKAFPELQALHTFRETEGVLKYFEGLEGVKTVYESNLVEAQPHGYYYAIGNHEQWAKLNETYFMSFLERRAKVSRRLSLSVRVLLQDTPAARRFKKYEKTYNEELRFLPIRTPFTSDLIITPKKVIFHQLASSPKAVVIENQSVVQIQRELFEIIWNSIEN